MKEPMRTRSPVALSDEDWQWVLRFLSDYADMTSNEVRENKARELVQDIRGWLPDRITDGINTTG